MTNTSPVWWVLFWASRAISSAKPTEFELSTVVQSHFHSAKAENWIGIGRTRHHRRRSLVRNVVLKTCEIKLANIQSKR